MRGRAKVKAAQRKRKLREETNLAVLAHDAHEIDSVDPLFRPASGIYEGNSGYCSAHYCKRRVERHDRYLPTRAGTLTMSGQRALRTSEAAHRLKGSWNVLGGRSRHSYAVATL